MDSAKRLPPKSVAPDPIKIHIYYIYIRYYIRTFYLSSLISNSINKMQFICLSPFLTPFSSSVPM